MEVELAPTLLLVLAAALALCLLRRGGTQRAPTVAGALPFLGNLKQLGAATKLAERMGEWADALGVHGIYEFKLLGQRYVVACSPSTVKELLSYRPFKLRKPASFGEIAVPGLFAAEGDQWKLDHRIVAPGFSHARVCSYGSSIKMVVERLIDKWATRAHDGAFAINADLGCFTADVVSLVAFGMDVDTLRQSSDVVDALHKLFSVTQTRMLFYPLFRYWRWLPFGGRLDGGAQVLRKLYACADRMINEYEAGRGSPNTILAKMIERSRADDESLPGAHFDRSRMRGNLLTLFIAGSDTTYAALTFLVYQLAKDAELQERAAKEAQAVEWSEGEAAIDPCVLAEKLPTLCATFYEVLRTQGPAPLLFCEVAADAEITVAGRTYTAADKATFIALCEYAGKRADASAPGEIDPGTFAPKRWFDADGRVPAPKPGDVYQSFGSGIRTCPGRHLVQPVMLVLCSMLLQKFEIRLEKNHPPLGSVSAVSQEPDRDVRIVARPRD